MHRAQPPTLAHQRNTHGTSNSRPLLSSFTSCLFFPLLFFSPSSVRWHEGRRESQEAARFNLFIPRSLLISSLISLPPSSFWPLSPFFLSFHYCALHLGCSRGRSSRKNMRALFNSCSPPPRALLPKRGIFPGRATNETLFRLALVDFPRPERYVGQKRK